MARQIGVSASTVRNRIEKMEDRRVIKGCHPEIDYDETGLQLPMVFICCAPSDERTRLAKEALSVIGVVRVQEVLNGKDNIQIEAIGTDTDDLGRTSDELNAHGLKVLNSKIIKSDIVQPFDHFGRAVAKSEST